MPLAQLADKPISTYQVPTIFSKEMDSAVVENAHHDVSGFLPYINGTPFTVEAYYNQILGEHNAARDFDPNGNPVVQRYTKIEQMVLRTIEPLPIQPSIDTDTGLTVATGEANLYPCITPVIGDVFIARIGSGPALFRVTGVKRLTFNRDSVFTITYILSENSSVAVIREALDLRTNVTFLFKLDQLLRGLSPLLLLDTHRELEKLEDQIKDLTNLYFDKFWSRQHRTTLLPFQQPAYDGYLNHFVQSTLSFDDHPKAIQYRIPVNPNEANQATETIFKRLQEGSLNHWSRLATEVKLAPAISRHSYLKGVALSHSGLRALAVLNTEPNYGLIVEYPLVKNYGVDPDAVVSETTLLGASLPWFPVLPLRAYVFTPAFYTGKQTDSVLAYTVLTYLEQGKLNRKVLLALAEQVVLAEPMTQLYAIPILLFLIKTSLLTQQ